MCPWHGGGVWGGGKGGGGGVDGDVRQRVERWVWRYLWWSECSLVQQCSSAPAPVYKVHCSLSGSLWVSLSLQMITASLAQSEAAAVDLQFSSCSYLPLLCQYSQIEKKRRLCYARKRRRWWVYFVMSEWSGVERRGEEWHNKYISSLHYSLCLAGWHWYPSLDEPDWVFRTKLITNKPSL